MAIADTDKDVQDIFVKDLRTKIALEKPFAQDVKRWWKRVGNGFYEQYKENGIIVTANAYGDALIRILESNYKNISNKFKFDARESLDDDVDEEIAKSIDDRINQYQIISTQYKGAIILSTAAELLRKDFDNVVNNANADGEQLTGEEIADRTRDNYNDRADGKAAIIAQSETQGMAEGTKNIEAEALTVGGVLLAVVKEWFSLIDDRTRAAHIAAAGQRVKLLESFFVGGEYLRYPGDPRGKPDNIIRCRCGSVKRFI